MTNILDVKLKKKPDPFGQRLYSKACTWGTVAVIHLTKLPTGWVSLLQRSYLC